MELFVTDLDGTMLYEKNKVKESTVDLMKKMQKKGIKLATATGRILSSVKFLKEEFGIDLDYYVLGNGSVLADKNYNIISQKTLDYNVVKLIYKYLDNIPLKFFRNALSNDYVYCFQDVIEDDREFFIKSDIDNVADKDLVSFTLNLDGNNIKDIENLTSDLKNNFSDKVSIFQNKHFIDIAPKNVSKGQGVEMIVNELDNNVKKIYTIGDSYNDISMLKITDTSFTFSKSPDVVKNSAGIIVDNFDESIEKYILK